MKLIRKKLAQNLKKCQQFKVNNRKNANINIHTTISARKNSHTHIYKNEMIIYKTKQENKIVKLYPLKGI